jgi:hypothetical protein
VEAGGQLVGQTRPSSAIRTALLATTAFAVVVVLMSASQGGPSYFIGLGEESTALEHAREVLGEDVSVPLADGHDGESFWLLARDPLLTGGEELAQYFDRPLYRAQRIGYPLIASPWGLAGEQALVWGLVLTNLAAIGIGTYLVGREVADQGGTDRAGYAFAANPLVWMALLFDFCDAVALVGLVAFVIALRRGRLGWAAVAALVGALTKESSALAIAAVVLLGRAHPAVKRVRVAVPAAVLVVLWRLYVMAQPGFGSDPDVQEFALVPFSGFEEAWRRGWVPNGHWLYAAIGLCLIPLAAAVVVGWWRRRESLALTAALPYALYVPFLSGQVLSIPVNSLRAFGPAITLAAMGLLVPPSQRTAAGGSGLPILQGDGREAPAGGVDP